MLIVSSENVKLNLYNIRLYYQNFFRSRLFKKCKAISDPIENIQGVINFPKVGRQSIDIFVLND